MHSVHATVALLSHPFSIRWISLIAYFNYVLRPATTETDTAELVYSIPHMPTVFTVKIVYSSFILTFFISYSTFIQIANLQVSEALKPWWWVFPENINRKRKIFENPVAYWALLKDLEHYSAEIYLEKLRYLRLTTARSRNFLVSKGAYIHVPNIQIWVSDTR